MHIHTRRQLALAFDLPKPEVVQLPLEAREVAMSEIYTHFSFERDGIMYIQLAARPGDQIGRFVADHGQEFDEEVRRGGPSAVYCAAHARLVSTAGRRLQTAVIRACAAQRGAARVRGRPLDGFFAEYRGATGFEGAFCFSSWSPNSRRNRLRKRARFSQPLVGL